jgi:hypothetical protein
MKQLDTINGVKYRVYISEVDSLMDHTFPYLHSSVYLPLTFYPRHLFYLLDINSRRLTSIVKDRMAPTDYKFEGWLGRNPDSVNGKMEWGDFEPKKWTEDDVDIQVTHCGMCGSDLHTLSSGWGEVPYRKST